VKGLASRIVPTHSCTVKMTKRRGDGADDDNNDEDAPFFIASATWQGVRSGYYFGTTVERGTGYYLDSFANSVAGGYDTGAVPPAAAAVIEEGKNKNQKKKKRVRIDESANTETTTTTQLLDDAERRAVGRKIVTLTPAGVVQAGVSLRRAMDQNALLRAKAGGAETYMDSEVALYEQIAALKAIAADPANLYGVLLNDDTTTGQRAASSSTTTILDDLMQLLLHENTDIAVAVTSVLLEWLDVDLLVLDNDESAPTLVVLDLATTLLSRRYNLADLLVDHLYRTTTVITTNSSSGGDDEEDNDDEVGRGTEDILAVLENLLEMEQQQQQQQEDGSRHLLATAVILCRDTKLIPWLFETASARSVGILSDITSREEAHKIISNWGAIPTTSATGNNNNNQKTTTTTLDGIEILLQIVARFRKTQPRDADEVELLENAATAMAGILNYGGPASIQAFLDAQGVELVLRCVKEKVYAGYVTLKWLDFSGGGNNANNPVYRLACERAVDAGLFKYIFALFQGKAYPNHYNTNNANGASKGTTTVQQQKKERKAMNQSIQNTTIRILYALTCHLQPQDGQERRERLVAKFADEKITLRLVDLLLDYDQRVRIAEYNFFKSDLAEEEDDDNLNENMVQLAALEAKLAAGGDTLHRLAAIAAFCGAASKSIHASILASLQNKESGVSLIREALLEFLSVLDETSSFKAQLRTLVQVLV
jgi:beta-catenin-like protein 1